MRMGLLQLVGACALVGVLGLSLLRAADEEKPKYTIKEVMQKAHKGGLLKKVADGKADDDDKKQLVDFYLALRKHKPPRGDEAEWKKKTEVILVAAKDVAAGKEGAEKKLQEAANCANCHKVHKP